MLGKLPLIATSFANLTTDESLEAVPIATDYEKLIPIHYLYFPIIRQGGTRKRLLLLIANFYLGGTTDSVARKFRAMEQQRKLRWQDLHPQKPCDTDANSACEHTKGGPPVVEAGTVTADNHTI
jgi:hypothetical protein